MHVGQPPTLTSRPGATDGSKTSTSFTRGSRCSRRFERATNMTTATPVWARFCSNSMPRSEVRNTSNPASAASRRRVPFLMPVQPCDRTVRTSCHGNSTASTRGSCSSSRSRNGPKCLRGFLQCSDRELSGHRGEVIEKHLERIASLEVVDEVPDRNPRSPEHRYTAENLRVAINYGFLRHDTGPVVVQLPLLQAIRHDPQRQGLDSRDRLLSSLAMDHRAGKLGNLGNPPTVDFLLELNRHVQRPLPPQRS